jgi:hypothetical protein
MNRQAEASLQRLLYDEINPVKEQLASLREVIEVMGTKIDVIINGQRRSAGAAEENLRLATSGSAAASRPDSRSGQPSGDRRAGYGWREAGSSLDCMTWAGTWGWSVTRNTSLSSSLSTVTCWPGCRRPSSSIDDSRLSTSR